MHRTKAGVLVGIVSAIAFVVQTVPGFLLTRWQSSGFEQTAPVMFGTTGQTLVVYQYGLSIAEPLVTVLLAGGLGYVLGRRFSIASEYRQFLSTVTVSSVLAVTLSWALVQVWYGVLGGSSWIGGLALLGQIASVSLVVTVGVFAGAAFASFRTEQNGPSFTETSFDGSQTDRQASTGSSDGHI